MRYSAVLVIAAGILGMASARAADFQGEFAWRLPLRDSVAAGRLYRIKVTPELFDDSRAFPLDIRIVDERGSQWPFFLWVPAPVEDVEPVRVEMLNRSVAEGSERYLRQDMRILQDDAPRGQGRVRHDRITLNTAGRSFIRRVEVYGSENQGDWAKLAAGYLIDQEQELKVVNRTILYPVSDFPYLQVRIYPNARDATEEIVLNAASVASMRRKDGELEDVSLRMSDLPSGERAPRGVQVTVLDQGVKNRPVSRLRVEAGTREFVRPVKVYGRNYETNTWRWVADGNIHRIDEQQREAIELQDVPYRFFKLEIYNYDDAPLAIDKVVAECVPRYLVVEAGEGGDAHVYCGSDSFEPPQYDLERRTDIASIPLAKKIRLGQPELNPNRAPPRWIESWGRLLATVGVGAVSLLVILVIVNMIRRQAPAA